MKCSRVTIGLLVAILIGVIVLIGCMAMRDTSEGVTIPPQPALVRPANEYESGELNFSDPYGPEQFNSVVIDRRDVELNSLGLSYGRPNPLEQIGLVTTGRDGVVLQLLLLSRPLDLGHGVFEYVVRDMNGVFIPVHSRRGHYVELEDGDLVDVVGYKRPLRVRLF